MVLMLLVDDLMLVVVLLVIMLVVHHDHDDVDHLCQKNLIVLFVLLVNGSCVSERFDLSDEGGWNGRRL